MCAAGLHVWGLDCHGFGAFSDPWPEFADPATAHLPLGRAEDASLQLEHAVRFIVAGHFAARCPEGVDRMVFFAPFAERVRRAGSRRLPAWRLISVQDQWNGFI